MSTLAPETQSRLQRRALSNFTSTITRYIRKNQARQDLSLGFAILFKHSLNGFIYLLVVNGIPYRFFVFIVAIHPRSNVLIKL